MDTIPSSSSYHRNLEQQFVWNCDCISFKLQFVICVSSDRVSFNFPVWEPLSPKPLIKYLKVPSKSVSYLLCFFVAYFFYPFINAIILCCQLNYLLFSLRSCHSWRRVNTLQLLVLYKWVNVQDYLEISEINFKSDHDSFTQLWAFF